MTGLVRAARVEPHQVRHFGTVLVASPDGNGLYVTLRDGKRAFAPLREITGPVEPGDEVVCSLIHREHGGMATAFDLVKA
jgi:hypothetical protein